MSHVPSRVLVTGAAGRLGSAVLRVLAAHGASVVGLDRHDPGTVETFFTGSASDVDLVAKAMSGVDAVIHLAALPSPEHGTPEEVFVGNAAATFVVLDQAARAGVTRSVIASSLSITGLPFAPRPAAPDYVPIDEAMPLQAADPYALSKQADEATAAMVARRDGMSVVALRFPKLGSPEFLADYAREYRDEPGAGAHELWSYLDLRDAATACRLGLAAEVTGAHPLYLAAPETLSPYPTEDLLARYLPNVPRRRALSGRTVPIDTSAATELLGFTPEHLYDITPAELGAP
ncbi:NAD-dependent epimerase/dehydratase family protein [Actinophytocola sp. NPDC049390]|uniref:NAD-dependent epimerase/dehydratase family protein n=1 Tax=Actinophytocola sp. NPDC049390 TaxID=3363894 RepID=UPI0037B2C993